MPDDDTPTELLGFRMTLNETVYNWRLSDTTARHTRRLRLATFEQGYPESAWDEARLLRDIMSNSGEINGVVLYACSLEAMVCLAFLAEMQAGGTPSWEMLLDTVSGGLEVSLEEIQPEEVTSDPPA